MVGKAGGFVLRRLREAAATMGLAQARETLARNTIGTEEGREGLLQIGRAVCLESDVACWMGSPERPTVLITCCHLGPWLMMSATEDTAPRELHNASNRAPRPR